MSVTALLAGNPNCGKTTLFNVLTGGKRAVGNRPGVTVDTETRACTLYSELDICDLPGIYSLSPFSPEELCAREALLGGKADVIISVIDGTKPVRGIYLTLQLIELGIPVTVAVNMSDAMRRQGITFDTEKLSDALGCTVVSVSARRGEGTAELARAAKECARRGAGKCMRFSAVTERALAAISRCGCKNRFCAVKVFERDKEAAPRMQGSCRAEAERYIAEAERKLGDSPDAIIAGERFDAAEAVCAECFRNIKQHSAGMRIDRLLTGRYTAFPIFLLAMLAICYISFGAVGARADAVLRNGIFGEGIYVCGIFIKGLPEVLRTLLSGAGASAAVVSLAVDGAAAGVFSVVCYLPQMLVLFTLLSLMEECGYTSRAAFLTDRLLAPFGFSGNSFVPLLVSSGCGVSGIMATRTIKNRGERRIAAVAATFIPCGAKLPVAAMISGALFGSPWYLAPAAYAAGMLAVAATGLLLKGLPPFCGGRSEYACELPEYRMPHFYGVFRTAAARMAEFVLRAGSIILLASIAVWLGSHCGWLGGRFGIYSSVPLAQSFIGRLGSLLSPLFAPLGFGNSGAVIATLFGLLAKEEIVGVAGVIGLGELGFAGSLSFLCFNLYCAPCIAAVAACRRALGSTGLSVFAFAYQCALAYLLSFAVYRLAGAGMYAVPLSAVLLISVITAAFVRQNKHKRRVKKQK